MLLAFAKTAQSYGLVRRIAETRRRYAILKGCKTGSTPVSRFRAHVKGCTWVFSSIRGRSMTLAERFARYADRLQFADLPANTVHETKRRFIDSFATAVGAMDADAFAIAKPMRRARLGQSCARTYSSGGRSSIEWATFVNGLLIRYLDYNDTYLSLEPAHPSDNLAAVLAVGEMRRRRRPAT